MLDENGRGTLKDLVESLEAAMQHQLPFPTKCESCGIPMESTLYSMCSVCRSILDSLKSEYWQTLHTKWEQENERLIENKRRITLGNQEA